MLAISTTILFLGIYTSIASTALVVTNSSTSARLNAAGGNMCSGGASDWTRRECVPTASKTKWRDVCHGPNYVFSNCPDYFLCSDIVDARGDRSIKCVPINQEGNTSPRATDQDPQIGTSIKKGAFGGPVTTQIVYEVTIANDMSASVAAVFISTDHSWIVKAKNNIVGKIRGKEITVCEGNPECLPTANYDFKKGDTIDFTLGLTGGQEGALVYTIWPSV